MRLLLLTMAFPLVAFACKCMPESEMRKLPYDRFVVAFRGTVTVVDHFPHHPNMNGRKRFATTFRVHEGWRGDPGAVATVHALDPRRGDCYGARYRADEEHLVYAVAERVGPVRPKWAEFDYQGWSDVVPEGTRILVQMPCYTQGRVEKVADYVRRLGPGRQPAVK